MKATSVHVILLFEIRALATKFLFEKATPANFSTINDGGTNTMNGASIYIRSKGTGIYEIESKWY